VPKEYRDPYSQAKIFVPTHEEIRIKSLEKELEEKLKKADILLTKLQEKGN